MQLAEFTKIRRTRKISVLQYYVRKMHRAEHKLLNCSVFAYDKQHEPMRGYSVFHASKMLRFYRFDLLLPRTALKSNSMSTA